MSDHADTIRRLVAADDAARSTAEFYERKLAEVRVERQQAIDERDAALENQADVPALVAENGRLKLRCEQAIDALREAELMLDPNAGEINDVAALDIICAALVNLGEQP